MKLRTKIDALVRILGDNELLDCEHLDVGTLNFEVGFDVSATYASMSTTERRNFKRAFGPFDAQDAYEGKTLANDKIVQVGAEGEIAVKFQAKLTRAYACKILTAEEVTNLDEDAWTKLRAQAEEGIIKFQTCELAEDAPE